MPLKSFRATVTLPGEIEEIVDMRLIEERYPSFSAYVAGLILFDIYSRRPHWLTSTLMREPQWLRDEVIAELVRDFKTGGKGGQGWFEKRIDELIAERKLKKDETGTG